ncbi:MAG: peptide ABC transporter substrate-binding protein [Thaumarchaeota archaeon]|nr:MAG: peptide ABC transporter substrate-binding protein [Nitrososphaerota archaeon]
MNPIRKAYIAAIIIVIVIALVGGYWWYTTTITPPAPPAPPPKVLVMGTTDKITVMDPAKAYDFYTWEVFQNIGEGLLKYKPGTTELVPGLAESYTVSDDGLTYTFKLREGLKFTDGTPFNATVVKWSIDRQMHLQGDPSWLVTAFVDSVEVIDEYTVAFHLKKPISYFPALVATVPYFPISPKAWPWDEFKDATVGIGPYKVTYWERDVELRLEANPDYYGEPPKTERFVVKFYADSSTMRMALEAGEIDIAWKTLLPTDIEDFKKMPEKYTVIEAPGPYIRYIVMRCNQAPFNNTLLRKAIAAAVDRERICREIFKGTTTPLYSMIPEGMWSHIDAFKEVYGEHNITLARQYLMQAGYSEENKFEMELWYTPTHYGPTEADVAAIIKESLEETGMISVTLKSAEWATYAAEYIAKGVMPIFLLGWYPDYIDPDDYTTCFLHSEYSPDLGVFYSNPEMDRLLEEAQVKRTIEERTALYEEIQRLMAEDAPVVPLFQGVLTVVARVGIKGVVLDPTMILRYYLIYEE